MKGDECSAFKIAVKRLKRERSQGRKNERRILTGTQTYLDGEKHEA